MSAEPRTAIEKIVARHTAGWDVPRAPRAGDFVVLRPRHVMTHDNTSAVLPKFRAIAGADARVLDPDQPVFAIDHDIQNHTPENLGKYAAIRAFAERQGVRYYPPGRGIAHQVMIEEGLVTPGSLVVGSDSHANMYGALGALGTPVVRTDAAAIWATGETWWQVPPQVRVVLHGELPPGVTGKDVILTLCALFNAGEVLNTAVEFHGDGVLSLSIEDRLTIANMTTEWGALAGWFPFDGAAYAYLRERVNALAAAGRPVPWADGLDQQWHDRYLLAPDPDADYVREIELDLATLSPHVTGPNNIGNARPASELMREQVRIDKAYLMGCVNGRLKDLESAARVFEGGRAVAPGVSFYVAAASSEVEDDARASGAWQRLLSAGAVALPPGCGACIGLGHGTLEPGEVGISATNRNFEGRMGSPDAACYLANPAVVAESAARGYIATPDDVSLKPHGTCRVLNTPGGTHPPQTILDGFPSRCVGRALYLPLDSINTDGIYGKDVTYRDDITRERQRDHAMVNYDPAFREAVNAGDILVTGRNFGTGSSREQAATALLSCGIRVVIAASASQTFQRNAFNNGLVVIECPDLADHLAGMFAQRLALGDRTIAGPEIAVDFGSSSVACGGASFRFMPVSAVAQQLVVAGGLEPWVARRFHAVAGGAR
jgi:homoaconitate hydratase